jgi:hypothetical protein
MEVKSHHGKEMLPIDELILKKQGLLFKLKI